MKQPINIQLTENQIPLYIDSAGERDVGIGRERIIVILEKNYVQPYEELHPTKDETNNRAREQVRADFSAIAAEYFETPIEQAHFIDECVECGAILNENRECISVFCPVNYNPEAF
jgi:hypothetical protein